MCGIAGVFDRSRREPASEEGLRGMLGALRHRGPDEFGVLIDREAGLGSARLSIIDLAGGGQPIPNEDRTLWIVFNGEVFNYVELRRSSRRRATASVRARTPRSCSTCTSSTGRAAWSA